MIPPQKLFLNIIKGFIDLIYPPVCLFCDTYLKVGRDLVCENCWSNLPEIVDDGSFLHDISTKLNTPIFIAHVDAAWEFNDSVQKIIHYLKYNQQKSLAQRIGKTMVDKLSALDFFKNVDLLLPVPLHKVRLRQRGYNQSRLLCQALSDSTGIPLDYVSLIRIKNTKSQTKLDMNQRMNNVCGAFQVRNRAVIADKNILIIDDVITTGSTINACAEQLIQNGANEVFAFSAAKA